MTRTGVALPPSEGVQKGEGDADDMKQRPWKRVLSLVLAFALVFAMPCVTSVYANGGAVNYIERQRDRSEKKVVDVDKTVESYTEITSENSLTTWNDTTNNGWYVAEGNVTISSRVTVTGDVKLILTDGCDLTINGGIQVAEENSLTIYG